MVIRAGSDNAIVATHAELFRGEPGQTGGGLAGAGARASGHVASWPAVAGAYGHLGQKKPV